MFDVWHVRRQLTDDWRPELDLFVTRQEVSSEATLTYRDDMEGQLREPRAEGGGGRYVRTAAGQWPQALYNTLIKTSVRLHIALAGCLATRSCLGAGSDAPHKLTHVQSYEAVKMQPHLLTLL